MAGKATKSGGQRSKRATRTGVVTSDAADKTIRVVVAYSRKHPLYGKYVNDRNVFFLPLPVRAEATGDQSPQGDPVIALTDEFAPGFPDDGTLTTNDANFSRIPLPQGNGDGLRNARGAGRPLEQKRPVSELDVGVVMLKT